MRRIAGEETFAVFFAAAGELFLEEVFVFIIGIIAFNCAQVKYAVFKKKESMPAYKKRGMMFCKKGCL